MGRAIEVEKISIPSEFVYPPIIPVVWKSEPASVFAFVLSNSAIEEINKNFGGDFRRWCQRNSISSRSMARFALNNIIPDEFRRRLDPKGKIFFLGVLDTQLDERKKSYYDECRKFEEFLRDNFPQIDETLSLETWR